MPNGIEWDKDEIEKYLTPIKKVDYILRDFAKKYNTDVYSSLYHGYLSREITFITKSKVSSKYNIRKSIYLTLKEKKWPPTYDLLLVVSNSYGKKELIRFIPVFGKIADLWKRIRWQKSLYEFKENIDEGKLKEILNNGKIILDNFNEQIKITR